MFRWISFILLFLTVSPIWAEVSVSSTVTRCDRLTSSLITCSYTVKTPVGYTVKFPQTIEQEGIAFITRTVFEVSSEKNDQLSSKVSYAFTIPIAGSYTVSLPDLSLNDGAVSSQKSLPPFTLEVLTRLPSGGLVSLPFIGPIEVNPQHDAQAIWVIMGVMVLLSVVTYFLIKRKLNENQPSILSKLRRLEALNALTPAVLRALLLESIGLKGGSYSNLELNAMISINNESGFDGERLIFLLDQLNTAAFSRNGQLSENQINDVVAFIEQQQVKEN